MSELLKPEYDMPDPKCPECGGATAWQLVSPTRWEGSCFGACGGYPVFEDGRMI